MKPLEFLIGFLIGRCGRRDFAFLDLLEWTIFVVRQGGLGVRSNSFSTETTTTTNIRHALLFLSCWHPFIHSFIRRRALIAALYRKFFCFGSCTRERIEQSGRSHYRRICHHSLAGLVRCTVEKGREHTNFCSLFPLWGRQTDRSVLRGGVDRMIDQLKPPPQYL